MASGSTWRIPRSETADSVLRLRKSAWFGHVWNMNGTVMVAGFYRALMGISSGWWFGT